jgi:hypothetical protein
MPDYRLDGRGSIPVRGSGFSSSLCVQTSSEADPASYPVGPEGTFPRGKARPGRDADHLSHLVLRSRMIRRYNPLPFAPVSGQPFHVFLDFLVNAIFIC